MVLYSHRRLTRREALDDMSDEDTQPCRSDRTICKSSNLISRKGRKSLSLHRSSLHSKFLAIILISICSETAYLRTNVPNYTGALGETNVGICSSSLSPKSTAFRLTRVVTSTVRILYTVWIAMKDPYCGQEMLWLGDVQKLVVKEGPIFHEAHKHFLEAKPKSENKSYSHDPQPHIGLMCQYKLFISRRTSLPITLVSW
jgi:hypothetical protein